MSRAARIRGTPLARRSFIKSMAATAAVAPLGGFAPPRLDRVRRYGWDGGYGTSAYSDPGEGLIGVQFTQQMWTNPNPPPVQRDFCAAVYQAIAD